MQENTPIDDLLFNKNNLDKQKITNIVTDSLYGFDDGELFLEYSASESLSFDDQILKSASTSISSGFGLRAVMGDVFSYAHSSDINSKKLKDASNIVKSIKNYTSNVNIDIAKSEYKNKHNLYSDINPFTEFDFKYKLDILTNIDKYLRSKNHLVKQVTASLSANWQVVAIIDKDGRLTHDIRPLVRIGISVIVSKDGRTEAASYGWGGREAYSAYLDNWQQAADKALENALVNLEAVESPAGQMQVVLGAGWPGILLHEAVGHGLEGDFNRKKTSVFSNLLGKRVAAEGVTVIDDGTIANRRGSLNIDDEGVATTQNILIEDGILKGYIQDKINARLMNMPLTGNGRRESYSSPPMPRMTNTYMLGGSYEPSEIIKSVKKGLYAANFGGGQVDITSGKFVFSSSEAYLIEDGKITRPVKGATIIGNGPDVLTKVKMIGNDMKLDDGIGTCGKAGQSVPVGVGQPTLLIDGITVGGTDIA